MPTAESIALSAHEAGLSVWFDLMVLTPGRDWQADIEAGIDAATWMALLVSAESLASVTVAAEVTRAVEQKKPLILLVLDDSRLELEHAPSVHLEQLAHGIIDFRRGFNAALARLVASLQSGEPIREPIDRGRRHRRAIDLPRSVKELLVALALPVAGIATVAIGDLTGAAVLTTRPGVLTGLALAGISTWLLYAISLLLRRRLETEPLFLSLSAGSVGVWSGLLQTSSVGPDAATVLSVVTTIAAVWAVYRTITDEDLRQWVPHGDGVAFNIRRSKQFDRISERMSEQQAQATTPADTRPYFYRLYHAADDGEIAAIVRDTLAQVMATEIGADATSPLPQPTIDFLLLSNRICTDQVRAFLTEASQYRVVLIAAPSALPRELAEPLSRVQWLELRQLLPHQIGSFILSLRGSAPSRLHFASHVRPLGFAALGSPLGVRQMAYAARSLSMFWLAAGLLAAASFAPPIHLAGIGLGVWQLAMVHWLYRRTLPLAAFLVQFVANVGLAFWIGTAHLVADRLTVSIPGWGTWSPKITLWLIILQAVAGPLQLMPARKWFARGWPRRCALTGPPHAVLLKGHLFYLLLALAAAIYMAINTPG